jgi:hypothetical protein
MYFALRKDHENYNALYSLALAAGANRWRVTIQTSEAVTPADVAGVLYLVVDWESGQDDPDDD